MSVSALFTRRVRGVRLVNLWGGVLLLVIVVGLYLLKSLAGGERADIDKTEVQIADEQRQIRLLKAEVAYLEQPERIERLSQTYLGMQPTSGKQEIQPADLKVVAEGGKPAALAQGGSPAR